VELSRPPLEMLPLVPQKVRGERFQGLVLITCWEKQNCYHQLRQVSLLWRDIMPDPQGTGKRWRATMLVFALAAISLQEKLGWLKDESSERPRLRSNLSRAYLQGKEIRVAWKKEQNLSQKATLTLEFRILVVSSGAVLSSASSVATIGVRLGSMRW
jgi:hypothetical protein